MKIRAKLSVTFIMLLIFGVTAVSSYAIMFIRNYLLDEGLRTIEKDAVWMALSVGEIEENDRFRMAVSRLADVSGYTIGLYTKEGALYFEHTNDTTFVSELNENTIDFPESGKSATTIFNQREWESIYVLAPVTGTDNETGWIRVSQRKDLIYEPITTIRWIIYTGMFISVGLILLVSDLFSRYLSRPILQLTESARRIAAGDVDHQIELPRTDEFGTLGDSINRMAARLRADTDQIQEASRKQNRFFADITHEIRNPLHTIMGSMEMLEMDEMDAEKKRRHLKNARSQAERMNRLFQDLLTLQRFDSDPGHVNMHPFDLHHVFERMDSHYRDAAEKKGLAFRVETVPGARSLPVRGDEGKIEQVLDNLISNAIKYTTEGSVVLACSVLDGFAQVSVTDTGIGIDQEHIPHLFDRFYRTDKARSRDSGGTGLGLAVVKRILDAHGSLIHVDSAAGNGSRFRFNLERVQG